MKLQLNLMKLLPRKEAGPQAKKAYACWTCSEEFLDPSDYLWHIQYCK